MDCPIPAIFPAMNEMFFSEMMSISYLSFRMSIICFAGAIMASLFQLTSCSLAIMNHAKSESGIATKSTAQTTMMLAAKVGRPVFSARENVGLRRRMYSVSAPRTPLIYGHACLASTNPMPNIRATSVNFQIFSFELILPMSVF